VHRPLREQRQDGGADVATPAAASTATAAWAASTTAEARSAAEAGAAESAAEAGTETAAEPWVERAVSACVLIADRFTEAAARSASLFVDGATVDG
jgi:hypothetical protein